MSALPAFAPPPLATRRRMAPEERFWAWVAKTESCWLWMGAVEHGGYGRFAVRHREQVLAHRYSYELHNGPISGGLFVLHSCDNARCVNPAHLRLGDHAENMRDRSERGRSWSSQVTHCPRNHLYDEANTYVSRAGQRHCRACHRDRQRARRAAQ